MNEEYLLIIMSICVSVYLYHYTYKIFMGIPWTSKNSYLFLYLKPIKKLYLKAMQNVMYHYTHLDVAERVNVYRKRRGEATHHECRSWMPSSG